MQHLARHSLSTPHHINVKDTMTRHDPPISNISNSKRVLIGPLCKFQVLFLWPNVEPSLGVLEQVLSSFKKHPGCRHTFVALDEMVPNVRLGQLPPSPHFWHNETKTLKDRSENTVDQACARRIGNLRNQSQLFFSHVKFLIKIPHHGTNPWKHLGHQPYFLKPI